MHENLGKPKFNNKYCKLEANILTRRNGSRQGKSRQTKMLSWPIIATQPVHSKL